MKVLHYSIRNEKDQSIESDEVSVGSPKDWADGQRSICADKGWTISIWDNKGNSY